MGCLPLPKGYINHEKVCIKSESRDFCIFFAKYGRSSQNREAPYLCGEVAMYGIRPFITIYFFSSNVPTINVELSVTNVYPLSGSLQGGTRLTVTGVGFGNDSSLVEVDVGDVICDVESVTDTEIVCLIADSGEVHAVTNLGTHRGTVKIAKIFGHLKIKLKLS